jgi:hypothetical protein
VLIRLAQKLVYRSAMHFETARFAGVGFALALLTAALFCQAEPPASSAPPPPPAARDVPPSPLRDRDGNLVSPTKSVNIGKREYIGPHTWRGVINVTADSTTFQDGEISAPAAPNGVPQGVTFQGDRRNITLRNLKFENIGDGINIGNDQRVDDFTIERCHFVNCRTPDVNSKEHLQGSRGNAFFGSKGRNWTIRESSFITKCKDSSSAEGAGVSSGGACVDYSVQYAMRLGEVRDLKVSDTKFENHNGKACMWLMFVHDAVFEKCEFAGGRITIGARPGDMSDVERGDCRRITFKNCTFNFGVFDDWPASMNVFPGASEIRFEGCAFHTKGDWWLEVDSRETKNISWDQRCTWNGKPVSEHVGVRSSMSVEQMKSQGVGPMSSSRESQQTQSEGFGT